jgi:inner membrane protein
LDNLTHSLVGLFLARAGFRHATPRGTAVLILAANSPDFDTVSAFGGAAAYIEYHRHITHSLFALPFMALLAVAIVRVFSRQPLRWLPAWLIAMLGVASHLLLDLTNVYGDRLLLPFSGHWFHWDITPVIDLTIWAIALVGIAAPALARLVGSEIGEKDKGAGNTGWAVTALLFLITYDYGRSLLHNRAVAIVDAHRYNGLTPRRSGAFPTLNPLVWTGTAELSNAYVQGAVDLRTSFRTGDMETFYKGERTPAVDAAMQTRPFQAFLTFVQYPLWLSEPGVIENGSGSGRTTRVRLLDLRFGNPHEPGFAATAVVNDKNQVLESSFSLGGTRPR